MTAGVHRTTLKTWVYAPPPRWYWIIVLPLLAVMLVSLVVFVVTLENPPNWIQPLWKTFHFVFWPLIVAAFIHSYVRIYKEVSSPTAAG